MPKRPRTLRDEDDDSLAEAFVIHRRLHEDTTGGIHAQITSQQPLRPATPPTPPPNPLISHEASSGPDGGADLSEMPGLYEQNATYGTRRQKDYMEEFMARAPDILAALLNREARPSSVCAGCQRSDSAVWRCRDCPFGDTICRKCMRETHHASPLHRLQRWNGAYFRNAEMWEVGSTLVVGHCIGERWCSHLKLFHSMLEEDEAERDEQELATLKEFESSVRNGQARGPQPDAESVGDSEAMTEEEFEEWIGRRLEKDEDNDDANDEDTPASFDPNNLGMPPLRNPGELNESDPANAEARGTYLLTRVYRIVHTNGIHHLPILYCNCHGVDQMLFDLVNMRLIPTSFRRHHTFFTAEVLDYYRYLNLEIKGSAYLFYQLLRRLTRPMSPKDVANLYHELRRMSRLWRWLKKLKWAGIPYKHSGLEAEAGEVGIWCPSCPQIDVNIPRDHLPTDSSSFLLKQVFVLDGNFKADHVRQKASVNDINLIGGAGMLAERGPYEKFLENALERATKAPCENTFKAIEKALLSSKACDITGIVATACARHGCFVPTSICDLFKGEQQKNADYSLLQAIRASNVRPSQGVLLVYDIACQYSVYLHDRIGHLLNPDLRIDTGIGLFHVHGHKEQCLYRFAPTYIPGTGTVAGEILESQWNTTNPVAPLTRTATVGHRAEVLDDHTSDSNLKKCLGMAPFLCDRLELAESMSAKATDYFEGLSVQATIAQKTQWLKDVLHAEEARHQDVKVMDIYAPRSLSQNQDPTDTDGPVSKELSGPFAEVERWLTEAMDLEFQQLNLRRQIRLLGKTPTEDDRQEVENDRTAVTTALASLNARFQLLGLPTSQWTPQMVTQDDTDFDDVDAPDGDVTMTNVTSTLPGAHTPAANISELPIEQRPIPFPSNGGIRHERASDIERRLRMDKARFHLEMVRNTIADKSFFYTHVLRGSDGQGMQTRARTALSRLNDIIASHCRAYRLCRLALLALNATDDELRGFQPLSRGDTRCSTAVRKPNVPGSTSLRLSWIWRVNDPTLGDSAEAKTEFLRVHWLRGRAQSQRWLEELQIVKFEMQCTPEFFRHKARRWEARASHQLNTPGMKAYALKQAGTWRGVAVNAERRFLRVYPQYRAFST